MKPNNFYFSEFEKTDTEIHYIIITYIITLHNCILDFLVGCLKCMNSRGYSKKIPEDIQVNPGKLINFKYNSRVSEGTEPEMCS